MQSPSAAPRTEADRERLRSIHATLVQGDVQAAGEMAARALSDGIEHVMVLSLAAGRLEQAGQPEEALTLLRRAKTLAPQDAGIKNATGLCLNQCGRPEEAIAEFDAALAISPDFAPLLANRAMSLVALARLHEARLEFEKALAIDPDHFIALNGLAALALRRGDAAGARDLALRALARAPGFPEAAMTLAGAELSSGRAAEAEAQLRRLLDDFGLQPLDRAIARGMLGDALDAQRRFPEAFAVYSEANRALQELHRAEFFGRQTTLGLLRDLTQYLRGKHLLTLQGHAQAGPARTHVFLVGFPRSGTTLLEQVLEEHPDVATLAEKECMIDAALAGMTSVDRFESFIRLPDDRLEPYREAYWKRVADEGVDPRGRVFVDKHPFHTFKLPLIARLFPKALILFARRDPRDTVLSCFRHRFQMTDPIYQMLTLRGTAELFAATMEFAEASEEALGIQSLSCPLEAIIADFDGETRKICDHLGIEWTPALRDFAAHVGDRGVFTPSAAQLARGLNAQGVGKWHDYADQMAPVLPLLAPWVERFGYS